MAEIDKNRPADPGRHFAVGRDRFDLRLDRGNARAFVETRRSPIASRHALARTASSAKTFAVNSGLMPGGSPMASAMTGLSSAAVVCILFFSEILRAHSTIRRGRV